MDLRLCTHVLRNRSNHGFLHDERDYEFAKKFDLPIEVVAGGDIENEALLDIETGTMVNSDFLNGMSVASKEAITKWLAEKGLGKENKLQVKGLGILKTALLGTHTHYTL